MMRFQRCECQCPDSELIQRADPLMRPEIDASAAWRMMFHGLRVSGQAGSANTLQSVHRQPHVPALVHRPRPAFGPGNSQCHNYPSPRPPVPSSPPVIRESFPPIIAISTCAFQLGPANITLYQAQTRLPLTPDAAAAVASSHLSL